MAKLLPPLIEGTIPAFYSENGIVNITIPFSMNRAVNKASVSGLAVKIKTTSTSTYLYDQMITSTAQFDVKSNSPYVHLRINGTKNGSTLEKEFCNRIKEGQFYKFQIAYIDEMGDVGYYSTVAVGKYTTKPSKVEILNAKRNTINVRSYHYTGAYSNKDITERPYSYVFNVYDEDYKLFYSTGEQLHNNENDTDAAIAYDSFDLLMDLPIDKIYYLQYIVKTVNNLTASSGYYRISQRETVDPEIKTNVIATLYPEDGYIEVTYDGTEYGSGSYMLMRTCSDSNFNIWDRVQVFRMNNERPDQLTPFQDFTVEQGKSYKYGLMQYNQYDLFSNKYESNEVYCDFEYAFLYDGKRQLKIKYNPKISSLKANVLETKIDTIGGQYPFIFRNGSVYYREFPISGLISMLSDENGFFLPAVAETHIHRQATPAHEVNISKSRTNLNAENFYNERLFKLEVMKWLTNGEAKLFRSPGEGNFIVRLIGTSLTPSDQLGRMLHTFNCTAYEMATYNYTNLVAHNILALVDPHANLEELIAWKTVKLPGMGKNIAINKDQIMTVHFGEMTPGDKVQLVLTSGEHIDIVIGWNGTYILDREVAIREMRLLQEVTTGYVTFAYKTYLPNNFAKISNIYYEDVPAVQIIGETYDLREKLGLVSYEDNYSTIIKNPKRDLVKLYYLKATRRPWVPFFNPGNAANAQIERYISAITKNTKFARPDPTMLYRMAYQKDVPGYKVYKHGDEIDLSGEGVFVNQYNDYSKVTDSEHIYEQYNEYDPTMTFYYKDGTSQLFDLSDKGDMVTGEGANKVYIFHNTFYTDKLEQIDRIRIGNGIIVEVGYQIKVTDFVQEIDNTGLQSDIQSYQSRLKELSQYMNAANTLNYDKYFEFAKNIEDLNHSINIKVSELLSIAEEDC